MTNEHKDDLNGLCKIEIKRWKAASESNPNMRYMVELMEIALADLTAQPVKLPHEWVYIRFTDRSKNQRMKCQIAWTDSLNSVIYDEEGAPLLISNGAYEVIREAGYEVQE